MIVQAPKDQPFHYDGAWHEHGKTFEVPQNVGESLVKAGKVEEVKAEEKASE